MAKQKKRRPGPGGPGRSQPKPHWQPIEALAMVAAHIDGMLQADREQYETLCAQRGAFLSVVFSHDLTQAG
jgi:hypothetical protein